jgi:predicted ATPase
MCPNALDSITIQGFKSIASVERLELRPINVVIGPNGSGKSNFIAVFAFLRAIVEGRLTDYVMAAGGAERVLHFGSKNHAGDAPPPRVSRRNKWVRAEARADGRRWPLSVFRECVCQGSDVPGYPRDQPPPIATRARGAH